MDSFHGSNALLFTGARSLNRLVGNQMPCFRECRNDAEKKGQWNVVKSRIFLLGILT